MWFRASTATVICVIAAGLAAGGCQAGSTTASGGSPTGPSAHAGAGSTAQAAGAGAAVGASTGAGTSTGTGTGSSPSAGAGSGAGVKVCQAANLSLSLGANSTQAMQVVDMTNRGSSKCRMDGFPGVDLVGAARSQQNYTWPLARSSAKYSPVTLQPGETAHFTVIYLEHHTDDGTNITVQKMVITPPNASTQTELAWNQSVLLQDAATHPGTYITPVAAGA
jgi:hypothetical protein